MDRKPDFEEDIQSALEMVAPPPRALRALTRAAIDVRAVRADATWQASSFDPAPGARCQGDAVQADAGDARPLVPRLTACVRREISGPRAGPAESLLARRAGTVLALPRAAARERPPRCG